MTALQNISRDPQIGGRKIELRTEIIAPALEKRREGYGEPIRDYNQELRED